LFAAFPSPAGVYSAEELKPLAEDNMKPPKDFDYFTFVHVGEGDIALKPPENYSLDFDKGIKPIDARDHSPLASGLSIAILSAAP
jgi:hypothetical protein